MVIKTKQIFKPLEDSDGLRILITRFYPRGIKKEHFHAWMRDLSPSMELLKGYKDGKYSWDEFQYYLVREISKNAQTVKSIYSLNKLSNHTDITFLCYEKDELPCHRHLIKEMVETPGLLHMFES